MEAKDQPDQNPGLRDMNSPESITPPTSPLEIPVQEPGSVIEPPVQQPEITHEPVSEPEIEPSRIQEPEIRPDEIENPVIEPEAPIEIDEPGKPAEPEQPETDEPESAAVALITAANPIVAEAPEAVAEETTATEPESALEVLMATDTNTEPINVEEEKETITPEIAEIPAVAEEPAEAGLTPAETADLPVPAETPGDVIEEVKLAAETEIVETPVAEREQAVVEAEENLLPETPAVAATAAVVEDEEEEEEETEEHTEPEYASLSREELVAKLEELVQNENVGAIRTAVASIKVAFLNLNKEFRQQQYQELVNAQAAHDEETEAEAPAADPQNLQADEIEERYKAAFAVYRQNKLKNDELLEKQKLENLAQKNAILEELKELIGSEETLKKTYDEFKTLQEKWKTIGMVPKNEVNTLWQNYHFLVEKFFDKVKINKELKDLDLKKNLEAKILLCEKTEELLLDNSITNSFKLLQQYHEEWKEIGPVPQDKKDELWERFKNATDKINERRHEHYEQIQANQEQNLSAKNILIEKAEQIVNTEVDSIKGWQEQTDQITELFKVWKTIGPAPKKVNNDIWAKFKGLLDSFFANKKEYFSTLKEQQLHNYNQKVDLCVQAEGLKDSTEWKNTTRDLIKLQDEWKKIGPVPRKLSDKIWKRFRSACDEFFSAKSAHFKDIQGQETDNLKLKKELIERVKEFEIGSDRNSAVEALKEFQREWMEIGFVPIKEKEKIQNEFRTLINKHFEALKMETITVGEMNYRNRIDKISRSGSDAGRVINKERNYLNGKIQQLHEDIKVWENNIGFFAESKTANLLKMEFEKKIQKAKEEIELLESKLRMIEEVD